jgi:hypothetical protein
MSYTIKGLVIGGGFASFYAFIHEFRLGFDTRSLIPLPRAGTVCVFFGLLFGGLIGVGMDSARIMGH